MFEGDNYQNETYQNVPNMSLMFTMYSPLFGNGNFIIQPPGPGEVEPGWPTVPYLPLEALIYQQMASNPFTSPAYINGGQNSGQQNVAGTQTAQDSFGTSRYQVGVQ